MSRGALLKRSLRRAVEEAADDVVDLDSQRINAVITFGVWGYYSVVTTATTLALLGMANNLM